MLLDYKRFLLIVRFNDRRGETLAIEVLVGGFRMRNNRFAKSCYGGRRLQRRRLGESTKINNREIGLNLLVPDYDEIFQTIKLEICQLS